LQVKRTTDELADKIENAKVDYEECRAELVAKLRDLAIVSMVSAKRIEEAMTEVSEEEVGAGDVSNEVEEG
jgi:hypothetical protein